jgi:hypothetical protein
MVLKSKRVLSVKEQFVLKNGGKGSQQIIKLAIKT